ncbi:TPA: type I-E CRISPR-associated protein Cas6/Cse3/CasE, partial [Shigella sonnei]
RFFVLSQERPAESDIFTIECRPFAPELRTGQSLCFNLRANPTICKAGKRRAFGCGLMLIKPGAEA